MEPYPETGYQPLPEHDMVASRYHVRTVIGKALLVIAAAGCFAGLFVIGSTASILGGAALVLGLACIVALFTRNFPARICCSECRKKMKAEHREILRLKVAHHFLICPDCRRFVDLGREDTLS